MGAQFVHHVTALDSPCADQQGAREENGDSSPDITLSSVALFLFMHPFALSMVNDAVANLPDIKISLLFLFLFTLPLALGMVVVTNYEGASLPENKLTSSSSCTPWRFAW